MTMVHLQLKILKLTGLSIWQIRNFIDETPHEVSKIAVDLSNHVQFSDRWFR